MAKFRTSHSRSRKTSLFSSWVRILFILVFLGVILFFVKPLTENFFSDVNRGSTVITEDDLFYLPTGSDDPIYHKRHYTLAYSEKHEQASWVAYTLTIDQLNAPKVDRRDFFTEDLSVESESSSFYDYKGSGYTKGHLVPAADRAFERQAIEETFLMSNISPQLRAFNGGIWRELEEQVRDWARTHHQVYIVCGPIFTNPQFDQIGENRVAVPDAFFKVVLTGGDTKFEAVGFIIPHEKSIRPLADYMYAIDEVERHVGLDFFPDLLAPEVAKYVEAELHHSAWEFDEKRFRRRVESWNQR